MPGTIEALGESRAIRKTLRRARKPLQIVCIYTVLYVALDRISWVQVLPDVGFTLWNPPPACSLALLLTKGLRFAPALFPAAVLADVLDGDFAVGVLPTLVMDLIIAVGYTAMAAMLRPFAGTTEGFRSVRDSACFLGVVCIGTLAIAASVGAMLMLMQALPPDRFLAAVRHFWVGDFTGIVGLFPVLITAPLACERWRELPTHTRLVDPAVFVLALAAALWIVFDAAGEKDFQFFYLLLLPLIWIGAKHGLAWCTIAIFVEQAVMIAVMTLRDYALSDVTDLQFLALVIGATGLILGTAVSERERSELRLRQQQAEIGRMARITAAGALGSAIVHQISQPLATVATYAHTCRLLLRARPQDIACVSETLAKVEVEALRAGEIVERLRQFVSNGSTLLVRLNLIEVARMVVAALADEAHCSGVDVHVDTHPDTSACVDRVQIEQVFVNLIRNGIEAAAESDAREKRVLIRLRHSGDSVEVDVEDSGPGVPPEIEDHLFQPFATGKPRGLGLGLLLSREIIRSHGGDLWYDRTVGVGARFTFQLPGMRSNADAG